MKQQIDIRKYAPFFHDGLLFSITMQEGAILMKICSAEITPEYIDEDIELSQARTLAGVLHLQDIQDIQTSGDIPFLSLMKTFDKGIILDFEFQRDSLEFGILWKNNPPKHGTNEFTTIVIIARNIWWENIPDLHDPFW